MAELGQDMEVDTRPVIPPRPESQMPWDISDLQETITAVSSQMLEPIRRVVREEVSNGLTYEQRMPKPPGSDSAIEIRKLREQLQQSQAERNNLSDQVDRLKKEAARAQIAVSERDARNKKLQQVIIETSQNIAPPMDDDIVTSFTELKHDIMKIVKRHFSKQMHRVSSETSLDLAAMWKECKSLTPENRELWVRTYIADSLYDEFFRKKRKIFGFDPDREDWMRNFEVRLEDSDKVSEADIVDWRVRTVSCGQKAGLTLRSHHDLAYRLVQQLRPIGPSATSEEHADARDTMEAICDKALNIALLFRSNTVSYSWLQKRSISKIPPAEREIIGSTDPNRPAELCKPWKIVFGGAVKNQDSEEDKVVLTKSELLVN